MENSKTYSERIKRHSPPSPLAKNTCFAFLFGGAVCLIGELLANLLITLGIKSEESYLWVTVILIFISGLLTAFGIFDKIARPAGAGLLVPVTGFANSVAAPALDAKNEGYIIGLGSSVFTIAGPVILYSTVSGIILGIIYFFTSL